MTEPVRWYEQGTDPDYRFTLANERTYLAWVRTALAVLAGSLLVRQFVTGLQPRWIGILIAAVLAVLAALLAGGAYFRWRSNEHAMRLASSLHRPLLVPLLAAAIAILGLTTAVVVL